MKIENTNILTKLAISRISLERTLELVGEKMSITTKTFHPREGDVKCSFVYVPSPEPYFIGIKQYDDTQVSKGIEHNLIFCVVSYSHMLNMKKFENFRKIEEIKFLRGCEEMERFCIEKIYPVFETFRASSSA